MKKKTARKGNVSIEMIPPIQITDGPTPTEEQIKSASIDLSTAVRLAMNMIGLKNSIRKRHQRGDSVEIANTLVSREHAEAVEQKLEEDARELSLSTVSILTKCLHIFAKESDLCTIDIHPEPIEKLSLLSLRQPLRLIGTSAHHAAVLFLQQCLAYDFLSKYPDILKNWVEIRNRIDPQLLLARIDWERMRCYGITVSSQIEPELWITSIQIREEITRADPKRDINDPDSFFTKSGLTRRLEPYKEKLPPDAKGKNGISVWKLKTIEPYLWKIAEEVPHERWKEIALRVE